MGGDIVGILWLLGVAIFFVSPLIGIALMLMAIILTFC
jgi:hypothetical protein